MKMLVPLHTLFNLHVLSCTLKKTTLCMIQNSAVLEIQHADILNTFKGFHVKPLFDFLANTVDFTVYRETPALNNQSCKFIYYKLVHKSLSELQRVRHLQH